MNRDAFSPARLTRRIPRYKTPLKPTTKKRWTLSRMAYYVECMISCGIAGFILIKTPPK